jgi:hypothetical protein
MPPTQVLFELDAMTQPRKILWFVLPLAMLLLLPSRAATQNYVTPVVQPTPPGLLITVNNGPGDLAANDSGRCTGAALLVLFMVWTRPYHAERRMWMHPAAKEEGATRDDYERLSQKIEDRTRLPLAIESVYRYVVFLPSKQYADVPVPNRFFAVGEDGELKVRGLECRRHDTAPLLARMQHELLAILAEAHDYDSYVQKLEIARGVFANYEDRLENGEVDAFYHPS